MPKLQASTPTAGARFGFSGGAGRLRGPLDLRDDAAISAPEESEGGRFFVGAVYLYEDEFLSQPTTKPSRLTPVAPLNDGMELGLRQIVIANPRGLVAGTSIPRDNLILVSCYARNVEYPSCGGTVNRAGSVDLYDFNSPACTSSSGQTSAWVKSLVPPINPTTSGCPADLPSEIQHFGTGIAVDDVTEDGIVDVIVGAPETDVETLRDRKGRIYIFPGHPRDPAQGDLTDFFDDPAERWLGIDAPEPADAAQDWGTGFGNQIAVARLTAGSVVDVVVGRHDHDRSATACATQPCPAPQGGSAYVFRGTWLRDQFLGPAYDPVSHPSGTWQHVSTSVPFPDVPQAEGGLDPAQPEYQVLRNPFGDFQPTGNPSVPAWWDWFGWYVFPVGDVGSPGGALDGIDDIIVHAEDTDFIGTGTLGGHPGPQVPKVGANFVYYGTGSVGPTLVDPDHVLLQRPGNVGAPVPFTRFGRTTARIDPWRDSQTGLLGPGLLMSEMDATDFYGNGTVYLIRLPLPLQPQDPWMAAPIVNAWGALPLLEPAPGDPYEAGSGHNFGAIIIPLDYKGNQGAFPGQQFIVTSRFAAIHVGGGVVLEQAGRAYPFVPPPGP